MQMANKPSLDQLLHEKSNELIPSESYKRGNVVANTLFNILRRHRKDVDRVIISGSIGKRTAVDSGPDFDLVIFLNDERPPFHNVLKGIKMILDISANELPNYTFKCIAKNGMYIAFEVSGFKFDLSPAANFTNENQLKETTRQINSLPSPEKEAYLWSPGLAECAVKFLKGQSSFCHSIIRLAKFWNANVNCGYIRGRSSIMELVAISSCQEVGTTDHYAVFKRFLQNIVNLINLEIYFEKYYKKHEIPAKILENVSPIIMDPINYYNNMGYVLAYGPGLPKPESKILMQAAACSLQKLETWKNDPHSNRDSFDKIFLQEPSGCFIL